jgi:hypothetical protein
VIGTALLVAALAQRVESDRVVGRTIVVPWLLGSALLGLGLPLAAPILVRGIAAVAAQRARTPAQLLAGRRSELEPATTTRVVAGLIVALFVTNGGQCVLAAFEDTPQYRRALRADTTGPQKAEVVLGPGAALAASDVSALQELPGVRALVPMRTLTTACGREMPPTQAPGEVPPTPATWCVGAFVGTCAELAALADRRSVGCRDDRTAWISTGGWHPVGDGPQPLQRPSRLVLERNDGEPGAALSVPVPTTTVTIPATRDDPNWTAVPGSSLFVPLDTPGAAAAAGPPRQWLAVLDGGSAARSSFAAAARAVPGVEWVEPEGLSDLRTVQGYRSVLFAAGGAALLVGLLALAIALIDRTVERRRQVGALRALGAPGAVVRGAHVMAAAWPVVAALPLAGAAGLFAGRTYLHVIDVDGATPWRTGVTTTLAAVVTGVVVAAATVPAAGTALRPDVLRRE